MNDSAKKEIWNQEDQENIDTYDKLLNEHGLCFKALDWGSRKSQLLRFQILADIGIKNGDSVLDVGCGLGDLYEWFNNEDMDVQYTGIDITESLVKAAATRFPDALFSTRNIMDTGDSTTPYDYVVASGIFAKRMQGGEEYMFSMIKRMFELSKKGLAFNSLNLQSENLDPDDFGMSPDTTEEFCKTLTPHVKWRHDYHPNDMTFYLYKEPQS